MTDLLTEQARNGIVTYIRILNECTAANIADLGNYCAPDMHFRDPFNNVLSGEKFVQIMSQAFDDLSDVSFEVLETFWSPTGAVIKWNFHFKMKENAAAEVITGLSEVRANDDGKVTQHLDYWDSGERIYARIPVVGGLIRFIRRHVSAGMDDL